VVAFKGGGLLPLIAKLENSVGQAKLRRHKYDSGDQEGARELRVDFMADVVDGRREPPYFRPEDVNGDHGHEYEKHSEGKGYRGGTAFRSSTQHRLRSRVLRAYLPRPETSS